MTYCSVNCCCCWEVQGSVASDCGAVLTSYDVTASLRGLSHSRSRTRTSLSGVEELGLAGDVPLRNVCKCACVCGAGRAVDEAAQLQHHLREQVRNTGSVRANILNLCIKFMTSFF